MARYDQLPIYRLALELTVFLEKTVRHFSRYHKYSIGERLRQTSWDVVTLVVRANNTPVSERRPLLVALRDKIDCPATIIPVFRGSDPPHCHLF